ncbi:N-terminal domain of NEFA-interacting nuclear protein NIP30-domain-containing protein [Lentinula edodes]|uniref:N-terminal domain of NEFA-interacting nuclear protein NIP30-domain-containing protein n=1 Tax=Lentinula edodes TaxID=5353 RepID=UPI001E8E9391|nr:N-terminal domain of NEFA-interacting nuclear protein NIP30-domain-containing protein [Lentinula edodes]KAH7880598.1 N-terminal domain of NEFA-interacting nuclear protein NIP30-domain-containing protein [Lentinula edodes]
MEDSAVIPSLSMGPVGSRFVSSDEIETAKARRDEQWKAAYARLGQEPPPQPQADAYDGRSLAEVTPFLCPFKKLAANRAAKQEEWEEKSKLANQFRALEEDEIMFLDSLREKEEAEEKARQERDGEEVKGFKEAVAARMQLSNAPPPSIGSSSATKSTVSKKDPKAPAIVKKDLKKLSLKGVVVKKKKIASAGKTDVPVIVEAAKTVRSWDTDSNTGDGPSTKKRRISESSES